MLRIKGAAGLDRANSKKHPENIAIVPASLAGDNTGLLRVIKNCSHFRDRDNRQKP